jgi:outer membrane autotransporter protein
LQISNVGGTGALTTGNGILVVEDHSGTSMASSFALDAPVYNNGYAYTLQQQSDGHWYLVSQSSLPPPGTQAIPALPVSMLAALSGVMASVAGYRRRRNGNGVRLRDARHPA